MTNVRIGDVRSTVRMGDQQGLATPQDVDSAVERVLERSRAEERRRCDLEAERKLLPGEHAT